MERHFGSPPDNIFARFQAPVVQLIPGIAFVSKWDTLMPNKKGGEEGNVQRGVDVGKPVFGLTESLTEQLVMEQLIGKKALAEVY